MDDVLGQVLLTAGDEDLGAADRVTAVRLGLGLGADDAEVGAGVRLGQAHGAGPAAFVHRRQVGGAQLGAGVGVYGQAGTGGQRGVEGEAGVGGVEHFLELHGEHLRHAHAGEIRVAGETHPTTFDIGGVGLLETGRSGHHAIAPLRALFVTAAVERGDELPGDLGRFFQNGVGGVGVDPLGQRGQARPDGRSVEDLMQDEAQIT
ncbi:hypothetical protein D3C84_834210 [compost metagenome]